MFSMSWPEDFSTSRQHFNVQSRLNADLTLGYALYLIVTLLLSLHDNFYQTFLPSETYIFTVSSYFCSFFERHICCKPSKTNFKLFFPLKGVCWVYCINLYSHCKMTFALFSDKAGGSSEFASHGLGSCLQTLDVKCSRWRWILIIWNELWGFILSCLYSCHNHATFFHVLFHQNPFLTNHRSIWVFKLMGSVSIQSSSLRVGVPLSTVSRRLSPALLPVLARCSPQDPRISVDKAAPAKTLGPPLQTGH